jgi:hypothetical protein
MRVTPVSRWCRSMPTCASQWTWTNSSDPAGGRGSKRHGHLGLPLSGAGQHATGRNRSPPKRYCIGRGRTSRSGLLPPI